VPSWKIDIKREAKSYSHGYRAGKYTVPVLWDKEEGTIVNNESAEIVRMFNSAFNDLAKKPDLDLCAGPPRSALPCLPATGV